MTKSNRKRAQKVGGGGPVGEAGLDDMVRGGALCEE